MAAPGTRRRGMARRRGCRQAFTTNSALPVGGPTLLSNARLKLAHRQGSSPRDSWPTVFATAATDVAVVESAQEGLACVHSGSADPTADSITIRKEDLIYCRRDVILQTLADSIGEILSVRSTSYIIVRDKFTRNASTQVLCSVKCRPVVTGETAARCEKSATVNLKLLHTTPYRGRLSNSL